MINWLKSLFESNKEQATIIQPYPVKTRKARVLLSKQDKSKMVTDYFINKLEPKELAMKYNVSLSTVYKTLGEPSYVRRII